jgi:ribosomal protein S18 acetylase RimI-like enzyme
MTAHTLEFRPARHDELPILVALLADDAITRARTGHVDTPTPEVAAAFDAIDADPNQLLLVGEREGDVVAFLQLIFLVGLSRNGMWRAQIESVRVRGDLRGQGIGEALLYEAFRRARERGCMSAQLTTDRRRTDAQRFYARLGFAASHLGMKLELV